MRAGRKMVVTCGAPGCGKTTYALMWLREGHGHRAVVSLDGLRHALFGSKRAFWDSGPTDEMSDMVRNAYAKVVWDLASHTDWDIMLPNTNLDGWFWLHAEHVAGTFGMDLETRVFMEVGLEELLARNALRPHEDRLEEHVVRDYYERFCHEGAIWRRYYNGETLL